MLAAGRGLHAGDEVGGNVTDISRVFEEVAHEPLDRQHGAELGIAVQSADPHLLVAGQQILRLAGMEVHLIAQAQAGTRAPAPGVVRVSRPTSAPSSCSRCKSRSPYRDESDPPHALDVPQPASRTFDVGFQQIGCFTVLLPFLQAGLARPRRPARRQRRCVVRRNSLPELLEESFVAGQQAALDERREDGGILQRPADTLRPVSAG